MIFWNKYGTAVTVGMYADLTSQAASFLLKVQLYGSRPKIVPSGFTQASGDKLQGLIKDLSRTFKISGQ